MPPATAVLLVRHGDVHNPQHVLYGRLPRFGLSERGRREIEALGPALAAQRVAALYASPRLRARQTAAILARFLPGVPTRRSCLLDEVRTSWQGTPSHLLRGHDFNFYEPPRGAHDERIGDVFERMARWLRIVARRHRGRTVVGVSHADPIQILKIGLLGRPLTLASLRQQADYPVHGSITAILLADGRLPVVRYAHAQAAAAGHSLAFPEACVG